MKDYRARIKSRADILKFDLNYEQLAFLNQRVNDSIQSGTYELDALDYAYFYIKDHYCETAKEIKKENH